MRHPLRCLCLALALSIISGLAVPPRAPDTRGVSRRHPLDPAFFNPQFCPNTIVRQKIIPRMKSDCPTIRVPDGLCRKCHMRKHDSSGKFANNRDIYDLSTTDCQAALADYVQLNPCDGPRVKHIGLVADGLKGKTSNDIWNAKRDLGEFMYDVCELCCDCVPIGLDHSKNATIESQYLARKAVDVNETGQNTLIHVRRGNCPAHYYYDTCRMWPQLRDIANETGPLNMKNDQICWKHVYPWWEVKSNRDNWLRREDLKTMSSRFEKFLIKMNDVLGCRDERVWTDCARLEMAQKRV